MQSVIAERREEERQEDLRVRELELQYICGAVAAAAGHKDGVKHAQAIRLFDRPKDADPENLPSYDKVMGMFGGARG